MRGWQALLNVFFALWQGWLGISRPKVLNRLWSCSYSCLGQSEYCVYLL